MARHARNAVLAFAQQFLGAASGAVGLFFVARTMPNPKDAVGIVGFALAYVGMFLALQRAFDTAHVKRVSEGGQRAEKFATYVLLKGSSTAATIALVVGSVWAWEELLGQGFETPLHVRVLHVILVYQVFNAFGELVRRTYEGRGNILVGQLLLTTEHVVKGFAMVYVAFYGLSPVLEGARNAYGLAMAYVLGAAALALVALVFVLRVPVGRPDWQIVRSHWRFALPFTVASTITHLSVAVPVLALQLFWKAEVVGLFTAPERYVKLMPAIAAAAGTALFPLFSRIHARGERAPETLQRAMRAVSLLLLPLIGVSVAIPEAVIHVLLSDAFLGAAPVLAILALGAYVNSMRSLLSMKLGGVDRPEEQTKAALLTLVTVSILSVVLVAPSLFGVPLLGMAAVGAALAVSISFLAGFGSLLRSARKYAGVTFPNLWRHALILLTIVASLEAFAQVVDPLHFRVWHLLLAGLASVAALVVSGVLFRELHQGDWLLARRLVHPGQWFAFFGQEGRRPFEDEERER